MVSAACGKNDRLPKNNGPLTRTGDSRGRRDSADLEAVVNTGMADAAFDVAEDGSHSMTFEYGFDD